VRGRIAWLDARRMWSPAGCGPSRFGCLQRTSQFPDHHCDFLLYVSDLAEWASAVALLPTPRLKRGEVPLPA
jgi:hypothetical protein